MFFPIKFFKIKKILRLFSQLTFSISLLFILSILSSIGSILEQNESFSFYQEKYELKNSFLGGFNYKFIFKWGLDHIYQTRWFFFLIFLFGVSLISCTITTQFPILFYSKEFFFRQKEKYFNSLFFFNKVNKSYFTKEKTLKKLREQNFLFYQQKNGFYGYKGLVGRANPMLVHLSLIILLTGTTFGIFQNIKAQEVLPKGELFHIQNPIQIGPISSLPKLNFRINDFWVEYRKKASNQFYSDLSLMDVYGYESNQQTISVNNPFHYESVDLYQSDWNLLSIKLKSKNFFCEFPLFPFKKDSKHWITWVSFSEKLYSLIIDTLQNTFYLCNSNGICKKICSENDFLFKKLIVEEILPLTGLLIKSNLSIPIIYLGFGLLMVTTNLSYTPYTQIWMLNKKYFFVLGSNTNRGHIQLQIDFENLIRYINLLLKKRSIYKA